MQSPNAGVGAHAPGGHAGGRGRHAHHLPAHADAAQRLDQALVTGVSTSLNYAFAALIQDSIEALALGGRPDRPGQGRPPHLAAGQHRPGRGRRRRRAGGAAGAGPRPGERLPRGGARTAGWWLSATGLSGAIVGELRS